MHSPWLLQQAWQYAVATGATDVLGDLPRPQQQEHQPQPQQAPPGIAFSALPARQHRAPHAGAHAAVPPPRHSRSCSSASGDAMELDRPGGGSSGGAAPGSEGKGEGGLMAACRARKGRLLGLFGRRKVADREADGGM